MKADPGMNLIILDRDGTINEDREDYVKSPDEWVPLPGALEAIARLNHAGWRTVVASNQAGLGRGLFDMAALNAIHAKMNAMLAKVGGRIDAVFFCPHTPEEPCDCRKPMPGLFQQIGERFAVDLTTVPVVGDSLRDLQAGASVGCPAHLVRTGKGSLTEGGGQLQQIPGVQVHDDLVAFAEFLIQQERRVRGSTGKTNTGLERLD
jgi:D-glycero-D-manno-heptose 1,7-bisphosphate phosphatase